MSDETIPIDELEVRQLVRLAGERRTAIVVSIHYQGKGRARVGIRWKDIDDAEGGKVWPAHRVVAIHELRRP